MTVIGIGIGPEFAAAGLNVRLAAIEAAVTLAASGADLLSAMEQAEKERTAEFAAGGRPADEGAVAATRQAYKALGKDPSRYRPSAEALLRRIALGKGLYRINNVVDVINLVSLRTGYSIGGYDAGRISPPVTFRRAGAGESYEAIGRGPINLEGLPVFADSQGPFGSPTSDSARTMVSAATTSLLMVIIGFGAAGDLDGARDLACAALREHCRAHDIQTALF
jgi:DNA/RNA-binding domain of Phe-tRNA-synthetase-like protein